MIFKTLNMLLLSYLWSPGQSWLFGLPEQCHAVVCKPCMGHWTLLSCQRFRNMVLLKHQNEDNCFRSTSKEKHVATCQAAAAFRPKESSHCLSWTSEASYSWSVTLFTSLCCLDIFVPSIEQELRDCLTRQLFQMSTVGRSWLAFKHRMLSKKSRIPTIHCWSSPSFPIVFIQIHDHFRIFERCFRGFLEFSLSFRGFCRFPRCLGPSRRRPCCASRGTYQLRCCVGRWDLWPWETGETGEKPLDLRSI